MKIIINSVAYTRLKALSFAPETDLTGNTVPINEFQADIITNASTLSIGQMAELRDDLGNLWANYWIVYAERQDRETVRVRAQSLLTLLDREKLPAVMYSSGRVSDILVDVFANTGSALGVYVYALDPSFASATVTGFCPEQTARERLQWVCFVIGAYVKSYFAEKIEILPIDTTETTIPPDRTFWKPQINYSDWVTAIRAKIYSFARGEPETTDDWVKDAQGNTYIVTEQEISLTNPEAPAAAPKNEITIDRMYLLNSGNVSAILSRLSAYYFKRTEVELDAIDNGEYIPGDKLVVYADEDVILAGSAAVCDFSFGVQARARIRLTAAEQRDAAAVTILYRWGDAHLGRAVYHFPVGTDFSVQNPYFDWMMGGHRYVLRPTTGAAEGTVASGGNTVTVQYAEALDLELSTGVLRVISVDEATLTDGVVKIK